MSESSAARDKPPKDTPPTFSPIPKYPYNLTSLLTKTLLEKGRISMEDINRNQYDRMATAQIVVKLKRMVREGLLSSRMNMSENGTTEYREYFPTEKFLNMYKSKSIKDRETGEQEVEEQKENVQNDRV